MKKKNAVSLAKVLLLAFCLSLFGANAAFGAAAAKKAVPAGQAVQIKIPAPSLANSISQDPTTQSALVYLPPSYKTSKKSYPVLYILSGWGNDCMAYTDGTYNGFKMQTSVDKLISSGTIKDMILVCVNGFSNYAASFYMNSPVTGNWEDFIVKDLVKAIDSKYRTIKSPKSRGISGHSMGGFGALNAAIKHPDVFGSVYAMSPGLFSKDGMSKFFIFQNEDFIKQYLDIEKDLSAKPMAEGRKEILDKMISHGYPYEFAFALSYGSAFAPDTKKVLPVDYPYQLKDGKPVVDQKVWDQWNAGFGLPDKVKAYKNSLMKLDGIGFEYGLKDEFPFIPDGCQAFAKALKEEKIPYKLTTFDGAHNDKLGERMEKALLPFFSGKFYPKK